MSKLVSVQDISCFGQCSLTVALPILSSQGIETVILPSGVLSTHTGGFKDFTVHDLTDEMKKIVNHWNKEDLQFDGIYTGYIGDSRQFDTIRDLRKLVKEEGKLYVDPAMADNGKLYPALTDDIVEGMRGIVREADVILPNLTEASFILNKDYNPDYTREDIENILKELAEMGPTLSILTGVSFEDGKLGAIAYDKDKDEFIEYYVDRIPKDYHGTGDVFSSVAIGSLENGNSVQDALKEACEFTAESIKRTLPDKNHNYGVKFEEVLRDQRK